MRRKKNEDENIIQEAEVVYSWSKKRIVVATMLVVAIIFGGIYFISLKSQNQKEVMGVDVSERPQLKLPNNLDIEGTIEKAKIDLGRINAENFIDSQPKLKQIINDLSNLTGSSGSAKELFCSAFCK